jgi:tight adherence protein C
VILVYSIVFGIVTAGMVLMLMMGLRAGREVQALDQERMYTAGTGVTLQEVELSQPFSERILRPMIDRLLNFLGRLVPARNMEDLQHRLEVAGRPNGWTVSDLMGLRLLAALVLGVLVFFLTLLASLPLVRQLLLVGAFAGLGYYLPILWLRWRIGQRKAAIVKALPDGLDMLNICVGAGLGFDASLSRVGEMWETPLADEFNRVVAEMRLGKARRQALLDLAARTEVMEIENFVATIVQADQLGVSIAKVLRTQAEQMRILRRQRAEEMARQATIKLLFPLVFLIFPSMLAVLLGPAVPQIIEALGSL